MKYLVAVKFIEPIGTQIYEFDKEKEQEKFIKEIIRMHPEIEYSKSVEE